MSSRGYEFQRVIGLMTKTIEPEQAKIELDVHERLRQALVVGGGFNTAQGCQALAPLATDFLDDKTIDRSFRREMKALVLAGTENADPDESRWLQQRVYRAPGRKTATPQSWLDQSLGGSLVEPEGFGELIQLVRNKEALINAGARVVPLPPSGRLRYPRQTAATKGYWLGENTEIPQSNFKTGSIVLTGKKACALVILPGELIRFASPASEAITRADMTKTLSLTLDFGLLQGGGGDNVPLGLLNTPNIATVSPTTANELSPQDVYRFMAAIESNNGEMEGWIMHPQLFWALIEARASVFNGTTTVPQGQFAFQGEIILGCPERSTLGVRLRGN
jgi:HK97 family phage major capsid protein